MSAATTIGGDNYTLAKLENEPCVENLDPNRRFLTGFPHQLARSTTSQVQFDISEDIEQENPALWFNAPSSLREPESELNVFVRHKPIRTRKIRAQVVRRTIRSPNPILPVEDF